MKIYQFTPQIRIIPDQPGSNKTDASSINTSDKGRTVTDFATVLANTKPSTAAMRGPGQTISLENQRASNAPQPDALGQAKSLMCKLNTSILGSSPDKLQNMHNLEALMYVYSPAGR